jgi:hypothetical protein
VVELRADEGEHDEQEQKHRPGDSEPVLHEGCQQGDDCMSGWW